MGTLLWGKKNGFLKFGLFVLGGSGGIRATAQPPTEPYLTAGERAFVQAGHRYMGPTALAEILGTAWKNPCLAQVRDERGKTWSLHDFNEFDQKWLWIRYKAVQAHRNLKKLEPQLDQEMRAFSESKANQIVSLAIQEVIKDNTPIFALINPQPRWGFAVFAYIKDTLDGRYFESKYFHDIPELQKSTIRQNVSSSLQNRDFDLEGQVLDIYMKSSGQAPHRYIGYQDLYHLFGPLMAIDRAVDQSLSDLQQERIERTRPLAEYVNACNRNFAASRDKTATRMLGAMGIYAGLAARDFAYNQCSHNNKMKLAAARAETSLKTHFVLLLKRQAFLSFAGLVGGICQRLQGAIYHEAGEHQYFELRR